MVKYTKENVITHTLGPAHIHKKTATPFGIAVQNIELSIFTLLIVSSSRHLPSNLQPNRRSREDLYHQESSDRR